MNEGVWEVYFCFPAFVCLLFMQVSLSVCVGATYEENSPNVQPEMLLFQSRSLLQTRFAPLVFQKTSRLATALLGLSMEEKLHSQDRQEISKSMKTSEETKLSWTTTWFLAGKVRPRPMSFPLSDSESPSLLKFCIPDVTNVVMQGFKRMPQVDYPGQTWNILEMFEEMLWVCRKYSPCC